MSQLTAILDYTAVVAGRDIPGVTAVAAAGSSGLEDPLRPGYPVEAFLQPTGDFFHGTEMPAAPDIQWVNQAGTVELTWVVPMRLYISRGDLQTVRRTLSPYFAHYLRAFTREHLLGNRLLRSYINRMEIGSDGREWAWLGTWMTAIERVNYFEET